MTANFQALAIAATHLNAPYGDVLTVEMLAQALRDGTPGPSGELAAILVSSLFCELSPDLIWRCADAAQASGEALDALYACSPHRSTVWEQARSRR